MNDYKHCFVRVRNFSLSLFFLVSFVLVSPVLAQDSNLGFRIHVYGTSGYGNTDGNHYQFGTEEGSYRNAQLAFALSAEWEALRIAAQVDWETSDVFDGSKAEVDYAFAEWRFSDATKLRLGRAKHAFGIYADILDVGTLRPFLSLPVGVYGATGAVVEHYTGAGIAGLVPRGSWELSYDVYLGEVVLDAAHPWEALEKVGFQEDERLRVSDLIGGRFVALTPVSGLSIGVSAFRGVGQPQREAGGEGEGGEEGEGGGGEEGAESISGDHSTIGLQVEYMGASWLIRSEYVAHEFENRHDIDSFYFETAYRFNSHWQLAARYDWADVGLKRARARMEINRRAPSLLEHEDVGLSLNYWFNDHFVVKLGYHSVDGNFFARPIRNQVRERVSAGTLDTKTDLLQIGVSFGL